MLEAMPKTKDTSASALQKKRSSKMFFQAISKIKKKVFTKIFHALHKILTFQQVVLSSSRGLANFRELEASRPKSKGFKMCPRGRPQGRGRSRGLHL